MIKVITCHHYRHKCAELFYLGIDRMNREYKERELTHGTPIQVFAAITKGDEESIRIAEANGAQYVLCENKPLGKKWNKAYELAHKNSTEHDMFVILGEDNLMSSYYLWNARRQGIVFGYKNCAIVDTATGDVKLWEYKDDQRLIGAGRMFMRPPAFKVGKPIRPIQVGGYKFDQRLNIPLHKDAEDGRVFASVTEIVGLWNDTLNSGLDRSSETNLGLLGYKPQQVPYSNFVNVIDLKTDSNIHKAREFKNHPKLESDWKEFLSAKEKEYIKTTWGI